MKLKKVASLALVGAMAVSMLAGCGDKNTSNGTTNPDNGVEVAPTSVVVDVFNKEQNPNKVTVEFTADSDFEKAVAAVVAEQGFTSTNKAVQIADDVAKMYGVPDAQAKAMSEYGTNGIDTNLGFYKGYLADGTTQSTGKAITDPSKNDGESVTALVTGMAPTGSQSVEAAARVILGNFQTNVLDKLPKTTYTKSMSGDTDYVDYTYTAKICVVETRDDTGAPAYYMACLLTQHVACETTPKV